MTDTKAITEHWTQVADQWIGWAGKPGHDAFWKYRAGLAAYIGRDTGRALEIGCGEGRVSRELKALGYDVTATDVVPAMLDAARHADSAHRYELADAASLPFDAASS
jgi:ubiquinone/menaquinone biosynthesis C-methylase UbiE